MPRAVVFLAVVFMIVSVGCAAPVRLTGYPGPGVSELPVEPCRTAGFKNVQVIGTLPAPGEYEELGYMTVGQSSSSELVYTSIDKQIEAARVRACQWGADAIAIVDSQGDKGNSWGLLTGLSYKDERESRVIAIRFLKRSEGRGGAASGGSTEPRASASTTALAEAETATGCDIVYSTTRRGMVTVRIFDRSDHMVRTLVSEVREPGTYTDRWDWWSDGGIEVRDGSYGFNVSLDEEFVASGRLVVRWPGAAGE